VKILDKVRNLPFKARQIIIWVIVIIIGLVLFFFWFRNVQNKLESFKAEEFKEKLNLPKLEMPAPEMPKFEIPEIYEEEQQQPSGN